MPELLYQLGIDWKLLLSQAVNFILLLALLTFLLFRPLLKIMRERKEKIDLGIRGAEEVEFRIAQADKIKEKKITAAESQALSIIKYAEKTAQKTKEQILFEARQKSDILLKEASEISERQRIASLQNLLAEAKSLVKEAIVRTVALGPEQVDEKLVKEAVRKIKEEKSL